MSEPKFGDVYLWNVPGSSVVTPVMIINADKPTVTWVEFSDRHNPEIGNKSEPVWFDNHLYWKKHED